MSRFYEFTYKRDFHLLINHDGDIRWSFGGILTTSCDIDLSFYPFDNQHCDIEIESWQYEKNKIQLDLYPGNPVNLDTAGDDPQWVLKEATVIIMVVKLYSAYSRSCSGALWVVNLGTCF